MNNDNQLPPAPVAEELSSEPVAWMHDQDGRVDVIHKDVKKLLADWDATKQGTGEGFHRPLATVAHYTIPLYTHPQPAVHMDKKAIYKSFCRWCDENKVFDLDYRLHTHAGPIDHGGYISHEKTKVAFSAYRAGIKSSLAYKPTVPDVDALAEFIRSKYPIGFADDSHYVARAICNWIEEQQK